MCRRDGVEESFGRRDLFLSSALMLFLELALIRWLGESILYLSFFTNFVLLASFLGLGSVSRRRAEMIGASFRRCCC